MLSPREPLYGDGAYECDGCDKLTPEHLVTEVPGQHPLVADLKSLFLCPDCLSTKWFSICSAHQQFDYECPRCRSGEGILL